MPVYKTEAIVIRRHNLGEADRIVTLLTPDQGKLGAVAKGARKPTSRFSGRLELFTHLRALLAVGRTLDVVSQVDVIDAFASVRQDLTRLGYASLVAEVIDRATVDRQAAPDLFGMLRAALQLISDDDPERAALWCVAQVLVHSGYAPVIDRCVICGRRTPEAARRGEPAEPAWSFSFSLGGIVCAADRVKDPQSVPVSAPALQSLAFLLRAGPNAVRRLSLAPDIRGELGALLQRSVEYRLDVRLRSPAVIQRLGRPATV